MLRSASSGHVARRWTWACMWICIQNGPDSLNHRLGVLCVGIQKERLIRLQWCGYSDSQINAGTWEYNHAYDLNRNFITLFNFLS